MMLDTSTERIHYLFTEDHRLLRETVRSWAQSRIAPHIDEWEDAEEFPRELFTELGSLGYLGLQYPEEYGGQGGDFAANLILCEELSRIGAESVSMGVAVHTGMAVPPILRFGTDEQKEWLLPDLVAGRKIAAIAISEPQGGSDVAGIQTRATRTDDGWVLHGHKTFITNGTRADLILVVARTGERPDGRPTFSLFLVDTSLPGVTRGHKLEKIGRRASDTAEVYFDTMRLSDKALLGEVGRGFHQLMWELEGERITSAATSVALGYHALDLALEYVKGRRQFGKRLADQQALRHNIADCAARLACARELVYSVAWHFQAGREPGADIAMAKLMAAQALGAAADYSLQLHGGYGYMSEYPIGRVWIDARVKRITAGTDEIMREIIANAVIGRVES
jgi:alkylation response protein AidB-like acyl-CoA dehydrogenase